METIKLKLHAGQDGLLKFAVPATPNQTYEVIVLLNAIGSEPLDEFGWPIGFFEETYGSLADDPIERGPDLPSIE